MRKLGTGLVVLLLVVAAAYGFYWYQVKSKADEWVQQLAPFAEVRYSGVYAHPDGTVGVNALTITPRQMHAPVSIDEVRVRAGSPLVFMFGGDKPPEQLGISLKQVRQGLDSELFRTVQQQSDLMLESNPLYVSPNALGCGKVRQFDINTLRRMGFSELLMDINLNYRGDSRARKVGLDIWVDIQDMADTRVELAFSADPAQLQNPMMASGSARLETMAFSYTDKGYNQRRDRFCAAEAELKPNEYQQQHQQLLQQWLSSSGVELPQSLLSAYSELQKPGAGMTLSMRPVGGLGAAELMLLDPVAVLESLNLQLSVNDKALALEDIDWTGLMAGLAAAGNPARVSGARETAPAPAPSESIAMTEPAEPTSTPAAAEVQAATPAVPQRSSRQPVVKRFQPTPLAELSEHVGAQVRIFTYFGNDVEGQLLQADGHSVRVLQRLSQGVAEYPLEYQRIQQAEVWR